uniref:Secreted protein n=1 Tax=Panagrellus redivivus TaxID=6233 RepID=A0A7E4ZU26_PANRE
MRLVKVFSVFLALLLAECSAQDALATLGNREFMDLNGGPLTDEQDSTKDVLVSLLANQSSSLEDVYNKWQWLKDSFPDETKDLIDEWEVNRSKLQASLFKELENELDESGNTDDIEAFTTFQTAAEKLASGNVGEITLGEYDALRNNLLAQPLSANLLNELYLNLSSAYPNMKGSGQNATDWFRELTSVGPALTRHYNESLMDFKGTVETLKAKLDNMTTTIRGGVSKFWNTTAERFSDFKNKTKTWIHEQHPKFENTLMKVEEAAKNATNAVSQVWNNFKSWLGNATKDDDDLLDDIVPTEVLLTND